MDGYRILLVDDEEELRAGIRRRIDWAALGFVLVGEAANGQDALELAEQLRPDVVLTDIKMPFMDGLTLCRRLKQQLPAVRLVIFSGFDEFDYARQAIGMNVFEYLLKPITSVELSDVLVRLKRDMDEERVRRQDMEKLRRSYEENLPVLRGLFYTRLLGGQLKPGQIMERAARYEIEFSGKSWAAARVHVSNLGDDPDELILLSLQNFFVENTELPGCQLHWCLYDDDLAVIAAFEGEAAVYDLLRELERVRALAETLLGLRLTVGVGLAVETPGQLAASVQGAKSALDYRSILGPGRTLYIGDLEPRGAAALPFDAAAERQLVNAVKLGAPEKVRRFTQGWLSQAKSDSSISQMQCFFLELVACLMRLAREAEIPQEEVFGPGFTGAVRISDFSGPEQLGSWVEERCLHLQELLRRQRSYAAARTVDKAREFIAENFSNSDLSVEMLCDHLHLSPAYFSTMFKRETGMSFTAYVTKVRMEAAAERLRTSEEKTYLIAEQTGYLDPNYFSYVFKRYFGTSPSKYRAAGQQGQ